MKISEIREAYYDASATVSELVRKLCFAGIAIIWLLRIGDKTGGIKFSDSLYLPLILFVASLGADLLQYIYKTLVFGYLNTHYWKRHQDNEKDVSVWEGWNWVALVFFWAKATFCVVAYVALAAYLWTYL